MNALRVRFGVLGISRVALKGMLPAMRDSEFAELMMIGSRDPEKARKIAKQFGAREWGAYEDVLQNNNIDAVYISFPNALHEEWSIKALQAGKHVICEKPAAISYAAGKRMVEAAKKNNRRILEGLMFRYHPQHARVRELIKNGTLGDLLKFEGCFAYAVPDRASNAMNKELGGGSFHDQACYPVSASRMIFKEEPESVLCFMEFDETSDVDIGVSILLHYPRGKVAFASAYFGSYYQSTYSVLGTKSHVRMGRAYAVSHDMEVKIFLDQNDRVEEITIPPADHFRIMLDEFCKEIVRGDTGSRRYEDDLLAEARVFEAARISAFEKRVVKISEML